MHGLKRAMNTPSKPLARHYRASFATVLFLIASAYLGIHQRPYPEAAGQGTPGDQFSSGRAMEHLRSLVKGPRPSGTRENEEARSYILRSLAEFGYQPEVQETTVTYQRDSGYVAARIRNIAVKKSGHASTRPVLLVSHYDTVMTSPGAGDNGAAVACLLETLRALQSIPQLRNDVILLFTDGEEIGLAGARAFVEKHPWGKNIGVVLNFEARGTQGPSVLFETTEENDWLIDQFAGAAPHPYGSSLVPALYKFMPHDTDLTAFREAGIPGMSFAFAEKWSHYHTRLDSLESIDERSIQHHGEYAFEITRRLADIDLSSPPKGNAVFFNAVGNMIIHHPASWTPALCVLAALLTFAAIIVGVRKGRLTVPGLLLGFAALLVAAAVSAFATRFALQLIGGLIRHRAAFYESGFYYAGVVCLSLSLTTLLYAWLSRKTMIENLHQGSLLCWLALVIAGTVILPEVTYLFMWPLLVGVALSLLLSLVPLKGGASAGRLAVLWFSALPVIFFLSPVIHMLLLATAGPTGFVVVIIVVLGVGLLLPVCLFVAGPRATWLPISLGAAAVALLTLAVIGAKPGPDYPKQDHMFYVANLDQGTANWATLELKEDAWTSQFLSGQGSVTELSEFVPDLLYPGTDVLRSAAPVVELAPPSVSVLEDRTEDGQRHLKLSIGSPRNSPEFSVFVESEAGVILAELDGARLQDGRVRYVGLKPSDNGEGGAQSIPRLSLRCYGFSKEPATLVLAAQKDTPIRLHVFERSYQLPVISTFEVRPRSAEFAEARFGDGTITYRSFTF